MKYILFALMLFTVPAHAALDDIQNKLRQSLSMTETCDDRTFYYSDIIAELEAIPVEQRTDADDLKLDHFYNEFDNWLNYCEGDNNGQQF